MTKVMAVILNYNSADDSMKCAGLLKKQTENILITIVDNCSTDDSVERLTTFCEKEDVIFIPNKDNKGFSAGNNIGLRKASEMGCDFSLIINPDVEIRDEKYLSKLIEKIETDYKIAVIASDIINKSGQHQNPIKRTTIWEDVLWPLENIKNKKSNKIPHIMNYNKSGKCDKLSGCCFLIRNSFLEKNEFLDENVFMYCEEPILEKMVKNNEMYMYYCSDLKAYHMHRNSKTKNQSNDRMKLFFKSRNYYLKQYSGCNGVTLKLALFARKMQEKTYNKYLNN